MSGIDTSHDGYLTAKREYCAACGQLLGSARYLIQNPFTGKHESVHYDERCRVLYHSRHHVDPLAPSDTSNRP